MTSIFGIKKFSIGEYAISANAILGIRDSGKTYAGCEAAEELFDAKIPSICIDPIGKWHSLRVPAKGGRGYPFVVAGGKFADLPLTRKNCGDLVRGAMTDGISLVIDLFSRDMSKADWRYIVQQVMEILLFENEDFGMRHVFIEEAGEFVPQRVLDGHVFNAVEKVVKMGGNSKLGCTLIHQRPEDINKSVLELCANVILLRQSGKNTITGLKKWFDLVQPDMAKEITESLPNLKSGDGWAFVHESSTPIRFQVPTRNSKHPDRRAAAAAPGAARAAVPVSKFLEAMKVKLAAAEAPKKAATSGKGHAAPVPAAPSVAQTRQADAESARALAQARQEGADAQRAADLALVQSFHAALSAGLDGLAARFAADMKRAYTGPVEDMLRKINSGKPLPRPQGSPLAPVPGSAPKDSGPRPRQAQPVSAWARNGGSDLPKGQHIVLTALAQHHNGCTRQQLTVLTGYKKTSRDTYLQQLAQQGLSQASGDRIVATAAGITALGPDFEPLPTGAALRDHVLATLPQGERRVLEVVIEFYDAACPRQEISDRTGYQKTSRDTYIQKLAARELVEVNRDGIKASDNLF